VAEPPTAAMAGADRAAHGDPGRSGSPRWTGTARPTTMVLDADVVVEPFTDSTLSESIRNVLSGRDEQRATSRGTREVARQAVRARALDRPYVGIVSPRHRPRPRLKLLGRKQPAPAGLCSSDAVGRRGHRPPGDATPVSSFGEGGFGWQCLYCRLRESGDPATGGVALHSRDSLPSSRYTPSNRAVRSALPHARNHPALRHPQLVPRHSFHRASLPVNHSLRRTGS
jgi:hypothetical protein